MDTNALSRQLAVYGAETQSKLMAMRVYISGLRGLGIQIAKNLILAGPKVVALNDSQPVRIQDLGSNFYLTEDHVGKVTRSQAVKHNLQNLNPNVSIIVTDNSSIDYISSNFNVVVITDAYDRNYLVQLNNACRAKNVGFIYAGNLGLYGYTFIDFGDKHRVHDLTGEQNKTAIIVGISNDQEGLVFSHEDKRHGFEDGDTIVFKQVKGMTQVNGKQFQIKVKSPHSFTIGDTSNFSPYETNGIAEQVKVPKFFKFNSLQKSLVCPFAPDRKELDLCNWQKIGRAEELHIILNALHIFNARHQRLPYNLNEDDANELVSIVQTYLNDSKQKMQIEGEFRVEKVDQELIRNVSRYADTQISPVCSFWGGIITQEIVKFTGKYSPLRQWLHHDFLQVLPTTAQRVSTNNRYSDYSVLFGHEFVESASKINTFLVGAGALGCEFIKMFALMGLATNPKSTITCTDDDNIEISNLNRQFLFRKENVGGNKSQVACGAGRRMNPRANFRALKLRVDPQNEQIFNDEFWDSLDFVVNAVDNVKARLYVDGRCVWYGKTLFESGTLGTKCNSQVVIPKFTQSYGDSQDPAEQTIPLCTLKNFPYQIEHTIQWARDYFEGIFSEGPSETSKYNENPTEYLNKVMKQLKSKPVMLRARLETIQKLSAAQQKFSYEACVQLAKTMFQDIFYNQIAQLLHSFPSTHTTQNGKLFWSGLKRQPSPIMFDSKDPKHLEFVQSAANIFAHIFGLKHQLNPQVVGKIADKIKLPEFQPRKINIKIDDNDKTEEKEEEDEEVVERLHNQLLSVKLKKGPHWNLTEFEKDDPTNFHIEFVGSVANLRARNYKIDEVDNFKVKLIAGKIIPAIATTTAMIVGAVGVEIIKKILNAKPETFKNSFMNLALPLWVFSDPLPPIEHEDKQYDEILLGPVKAIPPKFTNWEKIHVKGPLTIKELKEYFQKTYQVSLSMVSIGQVCIYNKYSPQSVKREGSDILAVYETITKKPYPKFKKYLQMEANGETIKDGIDAIMPTVKYER